jgi:hypothetical protein
LRFERASDFPPTLKDIRDAYAKARSDTNHFAFLLQNIKRMMDGKLALGMFTDGDDIPLLTVEDNAPLLLEHDTPMLLEHIADDELVETEE